MLLLLLLALLRLLLPLLLALPCAGSLLLLLALLRSPLLLLPAPLPSGRFTECRLLSIVLRHCERPPAQRRCIDRELYHHQTHNHLLADCAALFAVVNRSAKTQSSNPVCLNGFTLNPLS